MKKDEQGLNFVKRRENEEAVECKGGMAHGGGGLGGEGEGGGGD